ncbi:hypothetical protein GGR06_002937 [Bacteroides reticulotermitis]|uniref:RagB/SusD family nutrient uptake outer membrane protein n=1 Tax=Bacteroides reticulotermitis TaxID=1133319 RepID=A0A840CYF0_9BACE|nr:RagB/SusD family nutrient uptake outer membrane protein [Bacteroides reticulotermitis]MBB4045127.1 hypothetical protein [Bacteroides reticulotermitis]
MKNLFYWYLLIVGMWLFSSCTANLEQVETTDLDRESVFADSAYTARFLSQIYTDVGYDVKPNRFKTEAFGMAIEHGGLQTACDEAAYKVVSDVTNDVMFATGTINPVNAKEDDVWKIAYVNIRRANVFMKYVEGSPITENVKKQYKAEARFLRAWYYSMLLRHYGGVPLIGDNIYEVDDDMKTSRDTYADCVKYIVDECNLAALDLPDKFRGINTGRATAGSCKGLISRIRLYEASALFNGSDFGKTSDFPKELIGYIEYDKERWKVAVDAALDVIKMNTFAIYSCHICNDPTDKKGTPEPGWGFYAIFHNNDFYKIPDGGAGVIYPDGTYAEMLFEYRPGTGNQREALFGAPSCGGNGNGGYIYHDMVEQFPMKDGKTINDPSSKYSYNPLKPDEGRDPRFANTVVWNGSKLTSAGDMNHVVYTHVGAGVTSDSFGSGTPTGYYIRKFGHRQLAGNHWLATSQAFDLIRYAEILLNYAEAANEYYGPNHEEVLGEHIVSPYNVLKTLRERAGIEPGDDGMYGLKQNMTYEEMRDAIRLERYIELAFEGHRFFDVRRWMIAEQTQNKQMRGYKIERSTNGIEKGTIVNVRKHTFRKAMYFFPIPYKETVKSKELLQNPYYE